MTTCTSCIETAERGVSCTVDALHRDGRRFLLLPYGRIALERSPGLTCAGCQAAWGRRHHRGCPVQRCPDCAGHLQTCSCRFDEFGITAPRVPAASEPTERLATVLPFRPRVPVEAEPEPESTWDPYAVVTPQPEPVQAQVGTDPTTGVAFLDAVIDEPVRDPFATLRRAAERAKLPDRLVVESDWRRIGTTAASSPRPGLHLFALARPGFDERHLIAFDQTGMMWRVHPDARRRCGFRWQRGLVRDAAWVLRAVAELRVG